MNVEGLTEGFWLSTHDHSVEVLALTKPAAKAEVASELARLYSDWFDEVRAWARALGTPPSECEDLAQDVFVVVQRKLDRFDGYNLPGWLYTITAQTVSDFRRRAWFRHVFLRPRDVDLCALPERKSTPAELVERRQERELLWKLLGELSDKLRVPLVLFELESYSGEQIATLLKIPIATVWSRLHAARAQLLERITELETQGCKP